MDAYRGIQMSDTGKSEIDELLALGRRVRELLTIEKGDLENCLLGLFSIAQRLNKEDDMVFAAKELIGYQEGDKFPAYRLDVFSNLYSGQKPIKSEDPSLSRIRVKSGVIKLEEQLNAKKNLVLRISSDRAKKIKDLRYGENLVAEIPWSELTRIISGTKLEMISRLNSLIGELGYGKIPEGIFKKFQDKVNQKIIEINPNAVAALEIAFESLGKSEDSERISTVAFACRRLVKAVADSLLAPVKDGESTLKDSSKRKIGEAQFLNRIEVFVDSLESPNSKYLLKEVGLLRDLMNEVPESMNEGIHLTISNEAAERLVLKSYIILGSIIMEKEKIDDVKPSGT